MTSFTLRTACRTPLPPYRGSPSRSSTASNLPVLAPEGTIARPVEPSSRPTSHSMVGFPRESRTSRARTSSIAAMGKVYRGCRVLVDGNGQSRAYHRRRNRLRISTDEFASSNVTSAVLVWLVVARRLVAGAEAPCGAPQGRLRLDPAFASQRHHREQQVADTALQLLGALGLSDLLERLTDLGGRTV